jgi:heme A synthase
MYIAVIIVAIALGAFILAPRFLGENEDAAAALEKVTPFQGIIGLIVVVFALLVFGSLIGAISMYDLFRISLVLTIFDILALGFVLGYGLISEQVLSKSENASTKGTKLNDRLQPKQELLGMAAIGLAVLTIVVRSLL